MYRSMMITGSERSYGSLNSYHPIKNADLTLIFEIFSNSTKLQRRRWFASRQAYFCHFVTTCLKSLPLAQVNNFSLKQSPVSVEILHSGRCSLFGKKKKLAKYIPSLSSCSCRIWSLVFLILKFKCSSLWRCFYKYQNLMLTDTFTWFIPLSTISL